MTVVADLDALASAIFEEHVDRARAGIDGVLDELFDDGGGTLDDFTGGDLVDQLGRQEMDAGHRRIMNEGAMRA